MQLRLLSAALLSAILQPLALAQLPAGNPINATVPDTFWSVELDEVVTIPNSSGSTKPRLEFLTGGGAPGLAYVVDQRGKIHSFNPTDAAPTTSLFLDLSTAVPNFLDGFQRGVRGLAFHPDFNNDGTDGFRKFYTSHSRSAFSPLAGNPKVFNSPPGIDHDSAVGEWTVDESGTVNTSSYRELIRIGQPESDHNIGQLGFNPTAAPGSDDYGNLYIALGDGGGPGDPNNLAQNISTNQTGAATGFPHGSILRIDPIATVSDPYQIPDTNPFAGEAGTIEEIWAYGLRNPHRFSWDPVTGKMPISDIGQFNIEEINLGFSGANFGWELREGTFRRTGNNEVVASLQTSHPTDTFTYPVAQYDRDFNNNNIPDSGFAVVGGFVYRGTAVPELSGLYLFGDFADNRGPIFAVDIDDLVQQEDFSDLASLNNGLLAPFEELRLTDGGVAKDFRQIVSDAIPGSTNRSDLRFGLGPDGEIYVLNKHDGIVRRFVSADGLTAGDADRNQAVDGRDYISWLTNVGNHAGDWSDANFDAAGGVGSEDLSDILTNFGTGANVATVPEPAGVALLFVALACLRLNRA